MNIKKSTYSGIRWTTTSAVLGVFIQLTQIAILSRFLSPEAFGLMALAVVAINFASAFSDIGLSQALIHYKNISQTQLSTLYWLNIFMGLIMAFLIIILSPHIAQIYDQRELTRILMLISLCFIFQSIFQQFKTLLQKNLFFKSIALIEIVSKFSGLLVSVVLAINGYGVYSLVFAAIATSLVSAIGYIIQGLKIHVPQLCLDIRDVKEILNFGFFTAGERFITLIGYNLDSILIGKLLGVDALGIYTLAKQLIMRPAQVINPIITRVTMPIMSNIQNDINLMKTVYLKTTNYLASINFPIFGLLAVFAPLIVALIFGQNWLNIVPIVQVLCVYGALRSTGNPIGSLIVARGKYKLGFYWNVVSLILLAPTIYIGSKFDLVGVCYALVILGLFMSIPNWGILVKSLCNAKFIEYHKQLVIPFFITGAACFPAYLIKNNIENELLGFMIGMLCAGLIIFTMNYIFNQKFIFTLFGMLGLKVIK